MPVCQWNDITKTPWPTTHLRAQSYLNNRSHQCSLVCTVDETYGRRGCRYEMKQSNQPCTDFIINNLCKRMNKQGAVVYVHTIVDSFSIHTVVDKTTRILDVTENYTCKRFTKTVILYGKAVREVAVLHIDKLIKIVAGVLRSKEMASVHNELLASFCNDGIDMHQAGAKMHSLFLDHVTQHRKLLRIYQNTSYLYHSTLWSQKVHCRKADIFFLEEFPVGQVQHHSCGGDNPLSQLPGGLCLCILIATELDKTFTSSLTLTGGESTTSRVVYKMSAGDTCLLFGMVLFCLPDTADT